MPDKTRWYGFRHYGTWVAEIGAATWFVTMLLAWARSDRLPIAVAWIGGGLTLGLLLIVGGLVAEARSHHRPLSATGIAHLHWLARFCPHAQTLALRSGTPTWGEARHVAELCRSEQKKTG